MNLKQLEIEFRRAANDQTDKFLWTHDEVVGYANAAEVDACERAFLIEDNTTPTICRIPVSLGKAVYELSPLIQRIRRAKLDSQQHSLDPTDENALDRLGIAWESTSGRVSNYIDMVEQRKVRLVLIPNADDVLRLTVARLPKRPMCEPTHEPEIPPHLHIHLVDGMLARAYRKQDSQTLDVQRADRHEGLFTMAFGARIDASQARQRRARRRHVTKMGPYG